jgi:hypothetical protein
MLHNYSEISEGLWCGTDGAPKPKRSLEDMMGSGAAITIGFGAPLSVPAGFGAAGSSTPSTVAPEAAGRPFTTCLGLPFSQMNIVIWDVSP